MRVLIVTAGSRGDVAPFTGLGQRLQEAGHEVTLAAHDRFADLVRDSGLAHWALPGDAAEIARERTSEPSQDDVRAAFPEYLEVLGDGVLAAAAAGADILLSAFGPAPISRVVADGLGMASIGTYLAPGVPTREFPPPGWPADTTPADNLAASRAAFGRKSLYADVLRRLRSRLDLPADPAAPSIPDDWPICHGFSPTVVPRPADWPPTAHVTGYWWPAASPDWRPPTQLVDFLAAGPPPVFVGFGSTPNDERLWDRRRSAAAVGGRADRRAHGVPQKVGLPRPRQRARPADPRGGRRRQCVVGHRATRNRPVLISGRTRHLGVDLQTGKCNADHPITRYGNVHFSPAESRAAVAAIPLIATCPYSELI